MAGKGWNWLEMAGIEMELKWKCLEMAGMSKSGWKCMEMPENGWKWLEIA